MLRLQDSPLALWVVGSALSNPPFSLPVALTWICDPIRHVFRTRELNFVLKQLTALGQRFLHVNQKYKWDEWSNDFDEDMYKALWSQTPAVPPMPSPLPADWEERLSFLQGFDSPPKRKLRSAFRKAASLAKRLLGV